VNHSKLNANNYLFAGSDRKQANSEFDPVDSSAVFAKSHFSVKLSPNRQPQFGSCNPRLGKHSGNVEDKSAGD